MQKFLKQFRTSRLPTINYKNVSYYTRLVNVDIMYTKCKYQPINKCFKLCLSFGICQVRYGENTGYRTPTLSPLLEFSIYFKRIWDAIN